MSWLKKPVIIKSDYFLANESGNEETGLFSTCQTWTERQNTINTVECDYEIW